MNSVPELRLCVLYPHNLNIYADRGNILVLKRRCQWRGIGLSMTSVGIGDPLDSEEHDLFYLGGGQDADQRLCAEDLAISKSTALREASERGGVVLGICGGYQLLGREIYTADWTSPGAGILDVYTEMKAPRLVGTLAVGVDLGSEDRSLAGFENHAGRTHLGPKAKPLGQVLAGHGNNGDDGHEGARQGNVFGTYLHGPVLAMNVWFADWLVSTALGLEQLTPLDDALERRVHQDAFELTGARSRFETLKAGFAQTNGRPHPLHSQESPGARCIPAPGRFQDGPAQPGLAGSGAGQHAGHP